MGAKLTLVDFVDHPEGALGEVLHGDEVQDGGHRPLLQTSNADVSTSSSDVSLEERGSGTEVWRPQLCIKERTKE
jgi:hypothetical protein